MGGKMKFRFSFRLSKSFIAAVRYNGLVLCIMVLFPFSQVLAQFPEKPLDFVVGFGVGGSADRMARTMSSFLSEELGQPIRIINKKGASTMIAANHVLSAPADGYTIFASTFNPYLPNTIVNQNARYNINDFAFINAQWFDFEMIVTHKDSAYTSIVQILNIIKENPGRMSAAVVQGSGGHILIRMLMDQYDIPMENLNLVTFGSGSRARAAICGGQVDFIAISAMGSEAIREFIRPVAVVKETKSRAWDAPPINEALKPLGISIPIIRGSVRGFAVSMEVKEKYPQRFKRLSDALENTLARKEVQKFLKASRICGVWLGHENTQEMMDKAYEAFKEYNSLSNH